MRQGGERGGRGGAGGTSHTGGRRGRQRKVAIEDIEFGEAEKGYW